MSQDKKRKLDSEDEMKGQPSPKKAKVQFDENTKDTDATQSNKPSLGRSWTHTDPQTGEQSSRMYKKDELYYKKMNKYRPRTQQKKKENKKSAKKEGKDEKEVDDEDMDLEFYKLTTRFTDQVVVVTGGGQGIGRAVALRFAQEGAKIIILDKMRFRETVEEIKKECGKDHIVEGHKCDITDAKAVKQIIKQIIETYGFIDVMVNCVDYVDESGKLSHETDLKAFDKALNVNVAGAFIICQEVLGYMEKERYGRIINVTDLVGKTGTIGEVAHSAACGAVISMTKAMAKEYADQGIMINCVAVGPCKTNSFEKLKKEQKMEIASQIPIGRVADLDEIAGVVAFFGCEENSYATGCCLDMSGGATS